jgi:hypothetical protein
VRSFFGIKHVWRFVWASPINPADTDAEAKMKARDELPRWKGVPRWKGTAEEWESNNQYVSSWLGILTSGDANAIANQASGNEQDGLAAWEALRAKYDVQDVNATLQLKVQLMNRRLGEDEDPDMFVADLEDMRARLRNVGAEESDDSLLAVAINTLPSRYDNVAVLARGGLGSGFTWSAFKTMMRATYDQQRARGELDKQEAAMYSRDVRGGQPMTRACHKCKKFGHKQEQCPEVECFACHKFGHYGRDCPNSSAAGGGDKRQGGGVGGGEQGGGGNAAARSKLYCHICRNRGDHRTKECPDKKNGKQQQAHIAEQVSDTFDCSGCVSGGRRS